MTDAVKVALIMSAGACIPSTAAAVLGVLNRRQLGEMKISMDGNLTKILAAQAAVSHAEGMKDESDAQGVRDEGKKLGNGFDQRDASK